MLGQLRGDRPAWRFTQSGRLSAQPCDGLPGLGRGARPHTPCRSRRRRHPRSSLQVLRAKPRGSRDHSPCTCRPAQCPFLHRTARGTEIGGPTASCPSFFTCHGSWGGRNRTALRASAGALLGLLAVRVRTSPRRWCGRVCRCRCQSVGLCASPSHEIGLASRPTRGNARNARRSTYGPTLRRPFWTLLGIGRG